MVHISTPDEELVKFGLFSIIVKQPTEKRLIVQSEGLGLVPGLNGLTLGYSQFTLVESADNDDCHITAFFKNSAQMKHFSTVIGESLADQTLCTVIKK